MNNQSFKPMNPVLKQEGKMTDPIGKKTGAFAKREPYQFDKTQKPFKESNVLETKDNLKPKEASGSEPKIERETILAILYNGDNTRGLFTPKAERDDIKADGSTRFEEPETKLDLGSIGKITPSKKYEEAFFEDEKKNFKEYTIQTTKGMMTVAEAIKRGYNPLTKEFVEDETGSTESLLNKLSDEKERNAVKGMIDPRNKMMQEEEPEAEEVVAKPAEEEQAAPEEQTEEQPPAKEVPPEEGGENKVAGLAQLLGGGNA